MKIFDAILHQVPRQAASPQAVVAKGSSDTALWIQCAINTNHYCLLLISYICMFICDLYNL